MTLRSIDALIARKRAVENATIRDLCDAVTKVNNSCPELCQRESRFLVGCAYLAGVVDGKRAERAKRKHREATE
jgi:ribosomal protein S26